MAAGKMGTFAKNFSWMLKPYIVAAPMRVMSGPELAYATSRAGGLGFIGPGLKPEDTLKDLAALRELMHKSPSPQLSKVVASTGQLPIGVGFQLWNGDIKSASQAVKEYRPCAAWLFAPKNGQTDLDEWTRQLREACAETQIWVQIGTVREATEILQSSVHPDVVVVQGAESGGHGRASDGLGIMALFPEVADTLERTSIGLVAAGGIADGRGVAAAMGLGADAVAMGTRFLAAKEARISKGYQDEVVRASDGAKNTTRTMLYNELRGTFGWPEGYSPRTIINRSWHEQQAGVSFDVLKERHDEAAKAGDEGWGPEGRLATYAGAAVGLVHEVKDAESFVQEIRIDAESRLKRTVDWVSQPR